MNNNKTVRVKVRRRRLNLKKIILILLTLYVGGYCLLNVVKSSIRNIYISGNTILSDQKIIDLAMLSDYPSFYLTTSNSIIRRLKANPLVKDVKVKKHFMNKLYITISEYNIAFIKRSNNRLVTTNNQELTNDYNIINVPTLINSVPDDKYKALIKCMDQIDPEVKLKISEIEYQPNDVDDERFLLSMSDGNYVYLTLVKFKMINDYYKYIVNDKKGILYLDLGNYFEVIQ